MATTQECHDKEPFNFWPWYSNGDDNRELTLSEHLLGAKQHFINIHVSYQVPNYPAGKIVLSHFTDDKMETVRAESTCLK